MKTLITLKNGVVVEAVCIRQYGAFEGGMRYIFRTDDNREFRCVKDADGKYVEYVA